MENKKFFEDFKYQLESELGIKMYNVKYLDNDYTGEKCGNILFKIEGLDKWLFGAWVKIENKEKYFEVFCQPTLIIDKFKPSNGYFDINVYYKNEMYYTSELVKALKFMKKHEALFYYNGDNPYNYIPEWKAKLIMAKEVAQEELQQENEKRAYNFIQKTVKICYKLRIFQTMYSPDMINKAPCHINDIYYIYAKTKIAKIIVKYLRYKTKKYPLLGYICEYDNKAVWMAEYNLMKYDTPPRTKEEIKEECLDIKKLQKTEYKKQYDKLIKYVWED